MMMDVNCIIDASLTGGKGSFPRYGERYAQLAPKICLGKLGPTDGRQAGLDAQAALRQEVGLMKEVEALLATCIITEEEALERLGAFPKRRGS